MIVDVFVFVELFRVVVGHVPIIVLHPPDNYNFTRVYVNFAFGNFAAVPFLAKLFLY